MELSPLILLKVTVDARTWYMPVLTGHINPWGCHQTFHDTDMAFTGSICRAPCLHTSRSSWLCSNNAPASLWVSLLTVTVPAFCVVSVEAQHQPSDAVHYDAAHPAQRHCGRHQQLEHHGIAEVLPERGIDAQGHLDRFPHRGIYRTVHSQQVLGK